jgi:hypothetical protein
VRVPKKTWLKPDVRSIDLAHARSLILEALRVIEKDKTLEGAQAELRSILSSIEAVEDR